jgi:hypothetical protein
LAEKTRLKNAVLKTQRQKIQLQLKQKEETGDGLHVIDFEQLRIENAQYQAKIEERNQELLKLKTIAGHTIQIMNAHKVRLHGANGIDGQEKLSKSVEDTSTIKSEITMRRDILARLENESVIVAAEKDKVEHLNKSMKQRIDEFRVPKVLYSWPINI